MIFTSKSFFPFRSTAAFQKGTGVRNTESLRDKQQEYNRQRCHEPFFFSRVQSERNCCWEFLFWNWNWECEHVHFLLLWNQLTSTRMLGVASVVTILLSVLVGYFVLTNHESQSILKQDAMPVAFRGPARRDGVIFVSDGAKGIARESSLELAKLGYHVLVGVKSEEEKRSFAFESRKGLEVILFDVAEPATLVTLVYRLQQIRRDLDRPMVGVVINLAGIV